MASRHLLNQLSRTSSLNLVRFKSIFPAVTKYPTQNTLLTSAPSKIIINKTIVQQYSSGDTVPIVSYEEIKQLPKHPKVLLIDVREPQELQETGQIPTSINIPLGLVAEELGASVDKGAFKAKYGRDKPEKNAEIIFHCKIGKRSNTAAEVARTLGYHNSKNYLGSWTEWAEKEGLAK